MCPKKVASTGLSLVPVAIRVCRYKPSKVPTKFQLSDPNVWGSERGGKTISFFFVFLMTVSFWWWSVGGGLGQAYVRALDGLYQHTLIATGTRLRPLEATFLGHMLGTTPAKHIRV